MLKSNPIMEILKEKNEYSLFDIFPMKAEHGNSYSFIDMYNSKYPLPTEYQLGNIESLSKFYLYNKSGFKSLSSDIITHIDDIKEKISYEYGLYGTSFFIAQTSSTSELYNELKSIPIYDRTIVDGLICTYNGNTYTKVYISRSSLNMLDIRAENDDGSTANIGFVDNGSIIYAPSSGFYLKNTVYKNYTIDNNIYITLHYLKNLSLKLSVGIYPSSALIFNEKQFLSWDSINYIFDYINSSYKPKWDKLYKSFVEDFDEKNPYNIKTTDSTTDSMTSEDSNNYQYSDNKTIEGSNEVSRASNSNTYGVNSSAIPSTDNSSTDNSTLNQTDSNSGNSNTLRNYERNSRFNRDLTRVGNIGNKTITQLIEEKRTFLQQRMSEIIFNDFDEVFTRQKYIL